MPRSSPYLGNTPANEAAHLFDHLTDFCIQCGAHRTSIWLEEWARACPAGANVVGISHLLARRAATGGSVFDQDDCTRA